MDRVFIKGIFLLLTIICITPQALRAQRSGADLSRERNAAYEVKLINEFIDRFNDKPNTALRAYVSRVGSPKKFERRDMIATLFDSSKGLNNNAATRNFLAYVLDAKTPKGLKFIDSNWFVEVKAIFGLNGHNAEIYLVLQMSTGADSCSGWVITGIRDAYVLGNENLKKYSLNSGPANDAQSLPPTEYATNFLMLRDVFRPEMNPATYFSSQLLNTDHGKKFIQLIRNGSLTFTNASVIRFYCFQMPGYEFKVEKISRPAANSGWLITDIHSFPASGLAAQKEKILRRTL